MSYGLSTSIVHNFINFFLTKMMRSMMKVPASAAVKSTFCRSFSAAPVQDFGKVSCKASQHDYSIQMTFNI
jgi:hypothetical protein